MILISGHRVGMTRRLAAAVAAALLTVPMAACGSAGADGGAPRVVAAAYPLQYVAERVGGDHVTVTALVPPGVDAHDLELSPRQMATLAEADLVIYLHGFQPAVDDAVATHGANAFDVAGVVSTLGDGDEPADGHGHDHGEQGVDPHVWLDPLRLATIGDEVAARLSTVDPEHAAAYADNAARLRRDLEELDAEYTRGLADCARREIVVSHAAYGYLADRYDLTQIAVSGLSPEDEPTPRRLAEAVALAREHGATTIFFETLASDRVARVVAEETGATTAVLDPIEGLAPDSTEDYGSLMRANLAALRAALDCR